MSNTLLQTPKDLSFLLRHPPLGQAQVSRQLADTGLRYLRSVNHQGLQLCLVGVSPEKEATTAQTQPQRGLRM